MKDKLTLKEFKKRYGKIFPYYIVERVSNIISITANVPICRDSKLYIEVVRTMSTDFACALEAMYRVVDKYQRTGEVNKENEVVYVSCPSRVEIIND